MRTRTRLCIYTKMFKIGKECKPHLAKIKKNTFCLLNICICQKKVVPLQCN